MRVTANVKIDLRGLRKFRKVMARQEEPIRTVLKQWAARYRSFVQRRFTRMSRGGWPALSPATKRRRRRGKVKKGAKRKFAILIDTGTLRNVLNPVFARRPGALEKRIKFGVRVGYGGPGRHAQGGRATIADIARFHQQGRGRLPKREIIVTPTPEVLRGMIRDMKRGMGRLADRTINEPGR